MVAFLLPQHGGLEDYAERAAQTHHREDPEEDAVHDQGDEPPVFADLEGERRNYT